MISLLSLVKVGSSEGNISWFVQITDLHISKYYAADRTAQLRQLGKSIIKWELRSSQYFHTRADQYRTVLILIYFFPL